MNYQQVYEYVRDLTQNLGLSIDFFHGRKENLIETQAEDPLYAYMLPLTSTGGFNSQPSPQTVWQLVIIFYQQDTADSGVDQNNQDVM